MTTGSSVLVVVPAKAPARSCQGACFLIERRYALSATPPSTTAFVLPALLCQSGARRTGAGKLHCQRFASVGQCAVDEDMASAHLRIVLDQQSPAVRPGLRVRGSGGARPQRPPASPLHNAALPAVPTIRFAKAPLGAGHRLALSALPGESNWRYAKWPSQESVAQPSVVGTPYAPPSARLCGCRGTALHCCGGGLSSSTFERPVWATSGPKRLTGIR